MVQTTLSEVREHAILAIVSEDPERMKASLTELIPMMKAFEEVLSEIVVRENASKSTATLTANSSDEALTIGYGSLYELVENRLSFPSGDKESLATTGSIPIVDASD